MTSTATELELSEAQRERLGALADELIAGGSGLPSASEAEVHRAWIDRTLAVRPDLAGPIRRALAEEGEPAAALASLRARDEAVFDAFAYAVTGTYLMNTRVRKLLGYPGDAPQPQPAYPDESDYYLADGILDPVLERGPIYRPTPDGG